ncbi:MAG: SURF1 family cytochrome oxidase biogenesis protein [Pseudomonadota bacterium]
MIERLVATRLILPGVLAVFGVVFLVLLGNWQWQRLQWKEGLIAKLEATAQADPVPLQKALEAGDDIDELRFKRVVVRGQYDHSSEMHVWTPGDGGAGWSVLTLMVLDTPVSIRAGGANDRIIVDRGRVPDAAKEPKTRSEGQVDGLPKIPGSANFRMRPTISTIPST